MKPGQTRSWAVTWGLVLCLSGGCSRSQAQGPPPDAGGPRSKECSELPPPVRTETFKVGFVPIYEPGNPWGVTNTNEMVAEARKLGYTLQYTPLAKGDVPEQIERMQGLIDARVDAIILRPMDATALAPSVVAARKACIPVFTENRFLDATLAVPGVDYVTGIGADPAVQGQLIADWLIRATNGKASILEIEGTSGSSSAIGRKKGFDQQIAAQPGMKIVASESGKFDRVAGHDVTKRLLSRFPRANAIFTHNDGMALGALAAVEEAGKVPGKDVLIVSVDGVKEAVQRVIAGSIAAIEFNDPRFGAITFQTIEKYRASQAVPSKIVTRGPIIDSTNAAAMLSEAF